MMLVKPVNLRSIINYIFVSGLCVKKMEPRSM
jgi:hypothetical protein